LLLQQRSWQVKSLQQLFKGCALRGLLLTGDRRSDGSGSPALLRVQALQLFECGRGCEGESDAALLAHVGDACAPCGWATDLARAGEEERTVRVRHVFLRGGREKMVRVGGTPTLLPHVGDACAPCGWATGLLGQRRRRL
jgi:hypothetical protein